MHLDEIGAHIKNSPELRLGIVREIGSYSVALFARTPTSKGQKYQLAGSGTLVIVDGTHYILTAAHVWEDVLKHGSQIGLSMPEGISHSFWLDVSAVTAAGLRAPNNIWNEWGPDLVLLRIPPEYLGTIKAYKIFYDLLRDGKVDFTRDHAIVDMIIGAPYALGQFTPHHAEIAIAGLFTKGNLRYHEHGGFDYLDCQLLPLEPDNFKDFGGISGGGLWEISFYSSPSGMERIYRLNGVAFYQLHTGDAEPRSIRCHGPKSIQAALVGLAHPRS